MSTHHMQEEVITARSGERVVIRYRVPRPTFEESQAVLNALREKYKEQLNSITLDEIIAERHSDAEKE